jgi:quinol-cytochrome oxidoreductase complex cytochrome b subunit
MRCKTLKIKIYLLIFSYFIFYSPNSLGYPYNYVYADLLSTPAHIVPKWYFLPYLFNFKIKGSVFSPIYKFF